MRSKLWEKAKKFIGVTEEQEAAKKWRPVALKPTAPSHRRWFGRRGWRRAAKPHRPRLCTVATRREAKATFIRASQLQGVKIANDRATAQRRDREEGGHFYMQAFRRSQKRI